MADTTDISGLWNWLACRGWRLHVYYAAPVWWATVESSDMCGSISGRDAGTPLAALVGLWAEIRRQEVAHD